MALRHRSGGRPPKGHEPVSRRGCAFRGGVFAEVGGGEQRGAVREGGALFGAPVGAARPDGGEQRLQLSGPRARAERSAEVPLI